MTIHPRRLVQTATVYDLAPATGEDRYGNDAPGGFVEVATDVRVLVAQDHGDEEAVDRQTTTERLTVTAKVDAPITATAELVLDDGRRLRITEEPFVVRVRSRPHHLSARAEAIRG